MPLLILLGMLIVICIVGAKEKRDLTASTQRATDWKTDYNDWCERTVDYYLNREVQGYILSEENEDEMSTLWAELAEVAPELSKCWPILYHSQFQKGVSKDVRSTAIGYNMAFLVPFVLAKKGMTQDSAGITFHHRYIINQGTSHEIKRSKTAPCGLSRESIINLNKWLEKTMIEAGISDARIVFKPSIYTDQVSVFSGDFHWDKACPGRSSAYYMW